MVKCYAFSFFWSIFLTLSVQSIFFLYLFLNCKDFYWGGGVVRCTFVFRLCQNSLTFNTVVKSGGGGLFVQNYSSIRTVEKSDGFKKKLLVKGSLLLPIMLRLHALHNLFRFYVYRCTREHAYLFVDILDQSFLIQLLVHIAYRYIYNEEFCLNQSK